MEIFKENQEQNMNKVNDQAVQVIKDIESTPKVKAEFPDEAKRRRDCTLSEDMIKALVNQLHKEESNHDLYASFAAYFSKLGLQGLEKYFESRAKEELLHHKWIKSYLKECDAEYSYPKIDAINIDIPDRKTPFIMTVDKEIETTMSIYTIATLAYKEGDFTTIQWLYGNDEERGRLIVEQVEEENISRLYRDMVNLSDDWLTIQRNIVEDYYSKRK